MPQATNTDAPPVPKPTVADKLIRRSWILWAIDSEGRQRLLGKSIGTYQTANGRAYWLFTQHKDDELVSWFLERVKP
jgi:hypothetical protein